MNGLSQYTAWIYGMRQILLGNYRRFLAAGFVACGSGGDASMFRRSASVRFAACPAGSKSSDASSRCMSASVGLRFFVVGML